MPVVCEIPTYLPNLFEHDSFQLSAFNSLAVALELESNSVCNISILSR